MLIGVMAILGSLLAIASRNIYVDRLSTELVREAQLVGEALPKLGAADPAISIIDPVSDRLALLIGARITIFGADGSVLGDSALDPLAIASQGRQLAIPTLDADDEPPRVQQRALRGTNSLVVVAPVRHARGLAVQLAVPLDQIDASVNRIQRSFAVATFATAVLVAAVGFIVASRIAQPLAELRRQATAVTAGHLNVEVIPSATRELGDLGRAFNAMTRQLAASRTERDRARSRLEAMLANLHEGIVITDERGGVIRLNAAASRFLAHNGDVPFGQPLLQVSRDHEIASLLRRALTADEGAETPTTTIEHGRSGRTLEATAQRLDDAGEHLGLLVLRDVTDLRRLELMRREFVANVSHELRTPLASIKALVETLEAGAIDDQAVAGDFLHRIVGEVDRLATLVDDLLDLARLESGRITIRPEPLTPGDLLGRALDRLRPHTDRARLTLSLDVALDLPRVHADRARVEQVLINLVHNATKFTAPGGEITVSARVESNRYLNISVRDSGVGIAADEVPRLFERFYKVDKARRSDGTGLGLAIAKHIVQVSGGTIWAESQPGRGSTFSFTLPFADDERQPVSSVHQETSPRPPEASVHPDNADDARQR